MTEDEAKTKWCPFARVDSTGANRPNPGDKFDPDGGWPPCIASACMAWRQTKDPTLGWHSEEREIHRERHGRFVAQGYCGLAGRPE